MTNAFKQNSIFLISLCSVFYHEHVLVKEPSAKIPTPWHHDQSYYPIDGEDICSIWMPVDPVPQEATLKFVKGSHRWNKWFVPRKFETSKNYTVVGQEIDKYEPISLFQLQIWNYGELTIFVQFKWAKASLKSHNRINRILQIHSMYYSVRFELLRS